MIGILLSNQMVTSQIMFQIEHEVIINECKNNRLGSRMAIRDTIKDILVRLFIENV